MVEHFDKFEFLAFEERLLELFKHVARLNADDTQRDSRRSGCTDDQDHTRRDLDFFYPCVWQGVQQLVAGQVPNFVHAVRGRIRQNFFVVKFNEPGPFE